MAAVVGISALAWWINESVSNWILPHRNQQWSWHWLGWLVYLSVFAFTLGRWVAGHIFGWSLIIVCRYFKMSHNDAFSAMKLDSYRHFLRLRIIGDAVTVFPIKIDKVPLRKEWLYNPKDKRERTPSVFIPRSAMNPQLIEQPIEIRADHNSAATTTMQVKSPGELPHGS